MKKLLLVFATMAFLSPSLMAGCPDCNDCKKAEASCKSADKTACKCQKCKKRGCHHGAAAKGTDAAAPQVAPAPDAAAPEAAPTK